SIISAPLAGFFTDHFGRRPTLVGSLLAAAVATALLGLLSAPPAIAGAALVLGLVTNAYRPPSNATVADLVVPARRAHAYGLIYWANNLGMAISLIVGGALAQYGYEKLFLADASAV